MNINGIATIMKGEEVEGVGLLIHTATIITCAHVINTALGLKLDSQPKPLGEGIIKIKYPFISKLRSLRCEIIFWSPVPIDNSTTIDIAVLKVLDTVNPLPLPTKFDLVEKYDDRNIKCFGFPRVFTNGSWAFGKIDGQTIDQRYQVSGDMNPFATEVEKCFSGSPVIDKKTNEVIGILQSHQTNPRQRIFYILPTKAILEKYQDFGHFILHNTTTDQLIKDIWQTFQHTAKFVIKSSLSGLPAAALIYYFDHAETLSNLSQSELSDTFSSYIGSNDKTNHYLQTNVHNPQIHDLDSLDSDGDGDDFDVDDFDDDDFDPTDLFF